MARKKNAFTITYGQANIAIRNRCYYQYKPNKACEIPTLNQKDFIHPEIKLFELWENKTLIGMLNLDISMVENIMMCLSVNSVMLINDWQRQGLGGKFAQEVGGLATTMAQYTTLNRKTGGVN